MSGRHESKSAPSKVIHFSGLDQRVTQSDILSLCSAFGTVTHCVRMVNKPSALVSFASKEMAIAIVQHYQAIPCILYHQAVQIRFSSHQEISAGAVRSAPSSSSSRSSVPSTPAPSSAPASSSSSSTSAAGPEPPNRILLVNVSNVIYPVDVEIVNQIFSAYGRLEKIVIKRATSTSNLQILVQFSSTQEAINAMQYLNDQNVYVGACHMCIVFSNLQDLKIKSNDAYHHNFLSPSSSSSSASFDSSTSSSQASASSSFSSHARSSSSDSSLSISSSPNPVLLINGINHERMGCDHIFNLFSLYGFVVRVRQLADKRTTALVQFAEFAQAEAALHHLNGITLFGRSIHVSYSKHASISSSNSSSKDKGDDPLFKDYSALNMNRRQTGKNSPTSTLHISHMPPGIVDEGELRLVFEPFGKINSIQFSEQQNGRKMAHIQYADISTAAEALSCMHGYSLQGHALRISFSSTVISTPASSSSSSSK